MIRITRVLAVILVILISLVGLGQTQTYKITLINYPNQPPTTSAPSTTVVAINQNGSLVLGSIDDSGSLFFYHPKTRTYTAIKLIIPGSTSITPTGITSLGVVVGYYSDASGEHGFFSFGNHVYSPINFPGSVNTEITAINDRGDTVGNYTDADQNLHSFIRDANGKFSGFDFPALPNGICLGSVTPLAVGVDERREILGTGTCEAGAASALDKHGKFTVLSPDLFDGINDKGQVIGTSVGGYPSGALVVEKDGVVTTPVSGFGAFNFGIAIDKAGDLVGFAEDIVVDGVITDSYFLAIRTK
jgi:hypothetical protein